jgi:hypothetical protein
MVSAKISPMPGTVSKYLNSLLSFTFCIIAFSNCLQTELDPNVWFRNVEVVAAKRLGRETVQYVSNIYKYYIAYRLILKKIELKKDAKK